MKIKLHQSGGIVYLPTSNRLEGATTNASVASSSSSSSDDSKVPGFAKELISIIKENGIDNDVSFFLNRLQRTLDVSGDPSGQNISMREILSAAQMANRVRQNYNSYKNAETSLESQDAWAEPAVTTSGALYVLNSESGKVEMVKPQAYDPNVHQIMTNADVMNYRRKGSDAVFDNALLDNLANAIGMKTITDYVRNLIKDFGKTNITGYSEKRTNEIKVGIDKLLGLGYDDITKLIIPGPDGVYKINKESTLADQNLTAALNYLWTALPNNYRNTLLAKATGEQYDPEALLTMMIQFDTPRSISASYEHTASADSGHSGASGNESGAHVQHTVAETYAEGENAIPPVRLRITPDDSRVDIMAYAQNVGKIRLDQSGNPGKPITISNLAQLREDAYAISNVTRDRTVVFGNQLIDPNEIGGIVYDGSDMYRIVLPAKTINGGKDIVPDFELQAQLDEILENATNQGADESIINRYLQQVCPSARYNSQTGEIELPSDRKHAFLTFQGIAADNYISFDKNSDYLVKSDFNDDAYIEATTYGYANHKKNDPKRVEGTASKRFLSGATRNHLYKGNVFMPISSPMAGSMSYNQEYIPRSAYTNITGREIEHERQMSIKDQFASGARSSNWNNN